MVAAAVALLVLAAGVAGSLFASGYWSSRTAAEDRGRFDAAVRASRTALVVEMRRYEDVLLGVAGLFSASDRVTADEFDRFVARLAVPGNYPGAEGIAYVARRRGRYVATRVAPKSTWASVGLDLGRVPAARSALERARDSARAVLSRRYAISSDSGLPSASRSDGFTLFLPVYRRGSRPASRAERRAALRGWLAVRFSGARFLQDVLSRRDPDVRIDVYDGSGRRPETLVASLWEQSGSPSGGEGGLARATALSIYGSTWTMHARALDGFLDESVQDIPILVLVGGMLLSAMLAAFVWVLIQAKARALRLADETLERLRAGEERFSSVAASPIGIFHTDPAGRVRYTNTRWHEICGLPRDEVPGMHWTRLALPAEREALKKAWDGVSRRGKEFAWELRISSSGGGRRWVLCRTAALTDGNGLVTGHVGSLEDVTERKTFEAELARRALHDPLTGLPNRALFLDRLSQALDRGQRDDKTVAVFFLDLDRFKVINDSLGHAIGDRLLVAVARRLRKALRSSDTVARFGGDEFTVLSPDVADEHEARRVADRLARAIASPFTLEGREVFTTASVGIALGKSGTDGPEGLLRDADAAMYRAKEAGRSRHELFDEDMRTRVVRELDTENDLRRALERGEFRLYYQPNVDLMTGEIVSLEALIRWYHPKHGVIAPADFIPLAEETGLIAPIGSWVLEEACRQADAWRRALGPGSPTVAINLSARQLADPRLADAVKQTLAINGTDPSLVSLEITETMLMGDAETSITTLRSLKDMGVGVALDDFGTGYSSLSYLKRFPIDALKMDRTFVAGLASSDDDMAIAAAIMRMAAALGIKVIAEGVETADQLARLRTLGCGYAQGYYFSPPQPADTVGELLEREPWWVLAESLSG